MSEENLISLLNFNENADKSGPILNSPRSLEACNRQGIAPADLLKQDKNQIKGLSKFDDEESVKIFEEHFEERRKKKIALLLEVREEVLDEERKGLWNQKLSKRKL